jgi:pantothenate kinase
MRPEMRPEMQPEVQPDVRSQRQPELLASALEIVTALLRAGGDRVMVGVAGPPGAGKSTLAEAIVEAVGDLAVYVPMDGFHLSNVELHRLGLTDRKGAPETFDAAGFAHLLRRIAAGEELVYAPAYSRVLHESVAGVIPVFAGTRLVVVDGNYLLLQREPWVSVRSLLHSVIYVDAPDGVRVPGLLRRQRSRGLDEEQARDWVERSDEANARLVVATRGLADVVLTRGED